jgi:hypothetical protein
MGTSGRRDSNPRQTAWKAVTLPAELLPLNGEGRIRTTEGFANGFTVRPLWPLGNLPTKQISYSWWRELNPRQTDYKSVTLPLSYTSTKKYKRYKVKSPTLNPFRGFPHSINQISMFLKLIIIWSRADLNRLPPPCEGGALPNELLPSFNILRYLSLSSPIIN